VLEEGDVLVLYSDGLIDARPDLQLTPAYLCDQLSDGQSCQNIIDALLALAGAGTPGDDLTILVLRRTIEEGARIR
jgi:sigma-B regulation protein RsbU (phosphoserine phosphatase)